MRLSWQQGQIGEREEEIWEGRYEGERVVPVHTQTDRSVRERVKEGSWEGIKARNTLKERERKKGQTDL